MRRQLLVVERDSSQGIHPWASASLGSSQTGLRVDSGPSGCTLRSATHQIPPSPLKLVERDWATGAPRKTKSFVQYLGDRVLGEFLLQF